MQSASINRNAIILLPKQPPLAWIMQIDPQPMPEFTLEDLRQEQDVYLLPSGEVNTPEEAQQWALQNFSVLFESFFMTSLPMRRCGPNVARVKCSRNGSTFNISNDGRRTSTKSPPNTWS